ncbi:MAG: hypothetical protein KA841_03555 [Chitinophagales bacterium]|nr:hypothetical protein [Chitinophagales bacterium]
METRDDILSELKEIAPTLSSLQKKDFFLVPVGYFDAFSLKMIELVEQELLVEKTKNVSLPDSHRLQVPAGYFNTFSSELLKKIKADELQALAPTLAALPKKQSFEIPANYFNQFPVQMRRKVSTASQSKSASGRWSSLNELVEKVTQLVFRPQYTMAFAGTVSMIVIGSMFFLQIQQQQCKDFYCQLEQVSDEELNAYFETNADEFGESMLDFSLKESQQLNQLDFDKSDFQLLSDQDIDEAILD